MNKYNDSSTTTQEVFAPKKLTVFVSGLNYQTKEIEIQNLFQKCGNIARINIAKNAQKDCNLGFCHVEFSEQAGYEKAILLNGEKLDGRYLDVKPAKGPHKLEQLKVQLQNSTNKTLFIRNIPYNTSKEEIHNQFKQFGTIKEIRLPMCREDSSRLKGICFVDFFDSKSQTDSLELDGYRLRGRYLKLDVDINHIDTIGKNNKNKNFNNKMLNKNCKSGESDGQTDNWSPELMHNMSQMQESFHQAQLAHQSPQYNNMYANYQGNVYPPQQFSQEMGYEMHPSMPFNQAPLNMQQFNNNPSYQYQYQDFRMLNRGYYSEGIMMQQPNPRYDVYSQYPQSDYNINYNYDTNFNHNNQMPSNLVHEEEDNSLEQVQSLHPNDYQTMTQEVETQTSPNQQLTCEKNAIQQDGKTFFKENETNDETSSCDGSTEKNGSLHRKLSGITTNSDDSKEEIKIQNFGPVKSVIPKDYKPVFGHGHDSRFGQACIDFSNSIKTATAPLDVIFNPFSKKDICGKNDTYQLFGSSNADNNKKIEKMESQSGFS